MRTKPDAARANQGAEGHVTGQTEVRISGKASERERGRVGWHVVPGFNSPTSPEKLSTTWAPLHVALPVIRSKLLSQTTGKNQN